MLQPLQYQHEHDVFGRLKAPSEKTEAMLQLSCSPDGVASSQRNPPLAETGSLRCKHLHPSHRSQPYDNEFAVFVLDHETKTPRAAQGYHLATSPFGCGCPAAALQRSNLASLRRSRCFSASRFGSRRHEFVVMRNFKDLSGTLYKRDQQVVRASVLGCLAAPNQKPCRTDPAPKLRTQKSFARGQPGDPYNRLFAHLPMDPCRAFIHGS